MESVTGQPKPTNVVVVHSALQGSDTSCEECDYASTISVTVSNSTTIRSSSA